MHRTTPTPVLITALAGLLLGPMALSADCAETLDGGELGTARLTDIEDRPYEFPVIWFNGYRFDVMIAAGTVQVGYYRLENGRILKVVC